MGRSTEKGLFVHRCKACGSTDVEVVDAFEAWVFDDGTWRVNEILVSWSAPHQTWLAVCNKYPDKSASSTLGPVEAARILRDMLSQEGG
jgi:hypothetical protein